MLAKVIASSRRRSAFDADAQTFFTAASVTGATPKTRWNALVTGFKTSPNNANWGNLWEGFATMDGYNNNASSTLFGLKRAVDLTIHTTGSAPTRDSLGMTLSAASGHYLSATINKVFSGGISWMCVDRFTSASPGASRGIELATAAFAVVGGGWTPFSDGNGYADILSSGGGGRISGGMAVTANQHHAFGASSNGMKLWRDATQIATGGTPVLGGTCTTLQIAKNAGNAPSFNGRIAVRLIFQVGLTQAEFDWVRNLVKTTIGADLSMI